MSVFSVVISDNDVKGRTFDLLKKGSNLSSSGRFDTDVVPAAQVNVDVPVLYSETKKFFNRIWLKLSPVGGKV